jgi:hypothetical protein
MTVDQIKNINDVRKAVEDLEVQQWKERHGFEAIALFPLIRSCDHMFPWGTTAMQDGTDKKCYICHKLYDPYDTV